MKRVFVSLLALLMIAGSAGVSSAAGLSFGGGIHYLRNLGDIDESGVDLDKNSIGILGSVMGSVAMFKLEGQVEFINDYAGTDEAMWIPQGWALLGVCCMRAPASASQTSTASGRMTRFTACAPG